MAGSTHPSTNPGALQIKPINKFGVSLTQVGHRPRVHDGTSCRTTFVSPSGATCSPGFIHAGV